MVTILEREFDDDPLSLQSVGQEWEPESDNPEVVLSLQSSQAVGQEWGPSE